MNMTISGVNGVNLAAGTMGVNQTSDPESRDLQRQIVDEQKKLQELSANENMSMEEKMKKRQEIQKKISDLNIQLRQHQMEVRRQAMEEAKEPKNQDSGRADLPGDGNKGTCGAGKGQQTAGLSKGSMQAMISADSSMKQAKVQGRAARQMNGRAGVLEAEIKLDSARGGSVESKEKELAKVKEKAAQAEASQMKTLSMISEEMKTAQEADSKGGKNGKETEPKEIKSGKEKEADLKEGKTRKSKEADTEEIKNKKDWKTQQEETTDKKNEEVGQTFQYVPVDVRL